MSPKEVSDNIHKQGGLLSNQDNLTLARLKHQPSTGAIAAMNVTGPPQTKGLAQQAIVMTQVGTPTSKVTRL
jgi:hypothetical protein